MYNIEATFSPIIYELRRVVEHKNIFLTMGWQDVASRYRRSKLGAFWLTISNVFLIATLGFVFGGIFGLPASEFLPNLALGIILWTFITTSINEGCLSFIDATDTILQIRIPLITHILRTIWRNIIILGHNTILIPLLFLIFLKGVDYVALLAIPGLILLTLNLFWMALLLAVICTRYRDLTQIVANIMQTLFYVTPVIWSEDMLPDRYSNFIFELNPFFHLLKIVKSPLLSEYPSALNWWASIGILVLGWIITIVVFKLYHRRIPYWL